MHMVVVQVSRTPVTKCNIVIIGGDTLVEVVNEKGKWTIYKDNKRYPYSLSNIMSLWGY